MFFNCLKLDSALKISDSLKGGSRVLDSIWSIVIIFRFCKRLAHLGIRTEHSALDCHKKSLRVCTPTVVLLQRREPTMFSFAKVSVDAKKSNFLPKRETKIFFLDLSGYHRFFRLFAHRITNTAL